MVDALWAAKDDIQHVAFALLFVLALARGGGPERVLSGAIVAMWLVHRAYHLLAGGAIILRAADMGHLAIDLALLGLSWTVGLQANRVYPLWIGGAQIIAVIAHIYRISYAQIDRFAYDMMTVMPSYIQLTALALGVGFHIIRQRRLGAYPGWRNELVPSPGKEPG